MGQKVLLQDQLDKTKEQLFNAISNVRDVNQQAAQGKSLLMICVEKNNAKATEWLLTKGADLKKVSERRNNNDIFNSDPKGNTALTLAKLPLSNVHPLIYSEELQERQKIITLIEHQIQLKQTIEKETSKHVLSKDLSNIIFEYSYGDSGPTAAHQCVIL